ncbi:hypothetical protein SARC_08404 [Sphaeroforma arctica JP610]|uniref:Uncharacterized protein n=1 Tax=Sphaeroforma arctica JP610 TaxID=667725 RepID=A0A0L0FQW1_9EUKA|nr:hypothetical protein SARC_08404 [Sphaeroforma arctica JP610]KNC79192.1 hypothetical protein SARC_08404 [Sphaeroforma arctica JP610]|eukprot:XP_014153094.1 hypothetical protein SARC_08404 [Sphaeroforma arctica JP610]
MKNIWQRRNKRRRETEATNTWKHLVKKKAENLLQEKAGKEQNWKKKLSYEELVKKRRWKAKVTWKKKIVHGEPLV